MALKRNKNKIMIINITKQLNGSYKIMFSQKAPANSENFKGLMIFTFKTFNPELFYNFKHYGRWLDEKNKNSVLLLRLFKQSFQNSTSYYIS